MWQTPHPRHTQRPSRRRNHVGVFACLLISALISGIVIGRVSAGSEAPEQVFLNNAAPGTPTPSAQAEVRAEKTRAPLGEVVRPTAVPRRSQRARPTVSVSKTPRNSIDGSYGTDGGGTVIGPDLGDDEADGRLSPVESEVVKLTNAARRKAGCRPLRVDSRLVRSAKGHSADMAAFDYFSHNSKDGSSPWKRMERAGYRSGGAENIGRGYSSASQAVRGWMGSPSHRNNIVNCDLVAIGVGVSDGAGGPWWTQDFGYS
ncbi:hypothetical protein Misp01_07330 [Microtetraspora sp. NBRC 13810]|uniref:CAP domain-containing protein n=1 Tax=Microtetraspora sp. NBRC 13810 TaxID=3030990 RepID=UPI00249F9E98|nr:CAP domain-containing protein [Microtetraspora sp. NBRC 13810]GLW05603.1 hypothetical protein Misp01_07330 [Microtetraspora sp. NBRC 13810]